MNGIWRSPVLKPKSAKGMECLVIRVTGSELDRFEAAGYLDPEKRGDRAAKARAIECLCEADIDTLVARPFSARPRFRETATSDKVTLQVVAALHSYLAAFQSAAASAPLAPTRNVPV